MSSLKKALAVLLCVIMTFGTVAVGNVSAFEGGDGSELSPYIIKTEEQLLSVASNPNANYILDSNIGVSGSWSPISAFYGVFDGNGYQISISSYEGLPVDLGFIANNYGTIKNLTIGGSYVNDQHQIENYYGNYSDKLVNSNFGSICAVNSGMIYNCINNADFDAGYYKKVGGIVGYNTGRIENCSNIATVKTHKNAWLPSESGGGASAGGICGTNDGGTIKKCFNYGEVYVSVPSASNNVTTIGGIVSIGEGNGKIIQCGNFGRLQTNSGNTGYATVGGIAVSCGGTISECFNAGEVLAVGGYNGNKYEYETAAGIVAGVRGDELTVKDCYNTGRLVGRNVRHPIMPPKNPANPATISISNCYNYIKDASTTLTESNTCYELSTGNYSEEQMTSPEMYSGFDFENTWKFYSDSEYKYPQLKNNPFDDSVNIEYGTYPQSKVTDEATISTLDSMVSDSDWVSYGYYSGTGQYDGEMKPSNYMRFTDKTLNGVKYRGVTFDSYRPRYVELEATTSESDSYQDDNGYTYGYTYWFKYEPVKWQVLDQSTGLVICKTVIDSQPFNNIHYYELLSNEVYGDLDKTNYVNNYEYSYLRDWLNNCFYNTTFSNDQKSNILTTTLDNSGTPGFEIYASNETYDKLFLLSKNEVLNSDYGFSTNTNADLLRTAQVTDYAKCQGLYTNNSYYFGPSSYWTLRTAFNNSGVITGVDCDGVVVTSATDQTCWGVRPAMRLNELKSDPTGNYMVGDIIEYGTYPQSKVSDEATISALNSLVTENDWVSYEYYSGSGSTNDGQMVASNYMRYADIIYNGEKYRGVFFEQYRPYITGETSSVDTSYQDDNGYYKNIIYWFKYEPIEWRVIDPNKGLVMCANIIDSQAFNNYALLDGYYYGDSDKTYYASNYAESSIRTWLDNEFYNTAFSNEQQENICLSENLNNNSVADSSYDASPVSDKVFLLDFPDSVNLNYGFNTDKFNTDTEKRLVGSDYAKCQGLFVFKELSSDYYGKSIWWLRSPRYAHDVRVVAYSGEVTHDYISYFSCFGVCPAMKLNVIKNDTEFAPINYTLSYNANGGSGEPSSQTGNGNITISDVIPTKNNYSFLGWAATSDATTALFQPGASFNLIENTTLYAVWKKIDVAKPTCGISSTNDIADHQTASLIMSDTAGLAGYYWGTSSNFLDNTYTAISGMNQAVEKTITSNGTYYLTAVDTSGNISDTASKTFHKTTLITNGGTISQENIITMYGYSFIMIAPSKAGYTFVKWTTNEDGSGSSYKEGDCYVVRSSVTLYAQWEELSYTLTYNANGGSGAPEVQTGNGTINLSTKCPEKTGYTFLGWSSSSTAEEAEYKSGASYALNEDATLYAVYSVNTYTATFFADGDIIAEMPFTVDSTYITEPAVPEKEGYFAQWESYTLGTEDITINAVYNVKQYLAIWYVNGKKTTTVFDYGAKIKKPADPVYENHTFVGWSPEVPATMPAKDLEFTAVFKLNEASVKIVNYDKYNGQTLQYKSTITFRADVKNGNDLSWHVDGASYNIKDGKCTVMNAENDFTIYCTVIDGDGNIVKSKTETIKIKHSFWDRLLGFFIGLFGAFKVYEQ